MIKVITGDIDSGKSTRFMQLYDQSGNDIGLFSKKLYDENNQIIGYNLILLPEGRELPFIILKEEVLESEKENYLFQGRFAFLKESFKTGEQYILNHPDAETIWIDEIGGLEIKNLGFANLMKTLIQTDRNLIITIRNTLLRKFIKQFGIEEYEVLWKNNLLMSLFP